MVSPVRRVVRFAAAVCVLLAMTPAFASADHFKGGHIHWQRDLAYNSPINSRYIVNVDITYRWGGPPWDWSPAFPSVGMTLNSNLEAFTATDGAGFATSGTLVPVVTAVDRADNWMTVRSSVTLIIPNAAGPVTFAVNSANRPSDLLEGNDGRSYRLRTVIDGTKGTRSPRVFGPPKITTRRNAALSFQLLSTTHDGLANRFSFASTADSLLVSAVPCGRLVTAPCQTPMQVSQTGVVSWTPQVAGVYAVQFTATSIEPNLTPRISVPFDVLIEVVDLPPTVPQLVLTPAPDAVSTLIGQPLTFTATVTPSNPQFHVESMTHTELPQGVIAQTSSPIGTVSTLTLTPSAAGSFPVCVQASATTNTGTPVVATTGVHCYTVNVAAPIPAVTCPPPVTVNTFGPIDATGIRYAAPPPVSARVTAEQPGFLHIAWRLIGPPFYYLGQFFTERIYEPGNRSAPLDNVELPLTDYGALRKGQYTLQTAVGYTGGGQYATCSTTIDVIGDLQFIEFQPTPSMIVGGTPATLIATAPGGPVSFEVVSGPGSIAPGTNLLHAHGVGTIEVRATQAGNEIYAAAAPAHQFVTVLKTPTTLGPVTLHGRIVGENVIVTTTLSRSAPPLGPLANTAVTVVLEGSSFNPEFGHFDTVTTVTDGAGVVTASLPLLKRGNYTVKVDFAGNATALPSSTQAAFDVLQRVRLTMPDVEGFAGDETLVLATAIAVPQNTPILQRTVTFSGDGGATPALVFGSTDHISGTAGGRLTFPVSGLFTATATLDVPWEFFLNENGEAVPPTGTGNVVVKRALTSLTQEPLNGVLFVGDQFPGWTLRRTTTPSQTLFHRLVEFVITSAAGPRTVAWSTDSVGFVVPSWATDRGPYTVTASFAGDHIVDATTATASGVVYEKTELSFLDQQNIQALRPAPISARLRAVPSGRPIAGQLVTFTFENGDPPQSAITDGEGVATIAVTFAGRGQVWLSASFENVADHFADRSGHFLGESVRTVFFVNSAPATLSPVLAPSTAVVGNEVEVSARLTDGNSVGIANQPIVFSFSAVNTPGTRLAFTDANGVATLRFVPEERGWHMFSAQFEGSAAYDFVPSQNTATVGVYQRSSVSLTAPPGVAGATVPVTATLIALPQGTPLEGQYGEYAFNGGAPQVVYTDANGQATIHVSSAVAGSFALSAKAGDGTNFVTDAAGSIPPLFSVADITVTFADTTPPQIAAAVNGPAGDNDWYVGPLNVVWAITDAQSAIVTREGCDPVSIATDGTTTLTCTAASGGGPASATVNIKRDATPPQVMAPANQVIATPDPSAIVNYPAPIATDATSGLAGVSCLPASGSRFAVGTTPVTCAATDNAGNTATATFTVVVGNPDMTPPTISGVTASATSLWPPNHALMPVAFTVSAADDRGPAVCAVASVSSNEPQNGLGDGDTPVDWIVTGALNVELRAERSGRGNGRLYTVTIRCSDGAGNAATSTAVITVPKSQKK